MDPAARQPSISPDSLAPSVSSDSAALEALTARQVSDSPQSTVSEPPCCSPTFSLVRLHGVYETTARQPSALFDSMALLTLAARQPLV